MLNSSLLFNMISYDSYSLRPTFPQFLYPLGKVESFKALEILIHSGIHSFDIYLTYIFFPFFSMREVHFVGLYNFAVPTNE